MEKTNMLLSHLGWISNGRKGVRRRWRHRKALLGWMTTRDAARVHLAKRFADLGVE